jgi:hypothetical protein
MKPSFRAHRVVLGDLMGLDNGTVRVRTDDDGEVSLPFDEVFEARLEVDWTDVMKKGNSRP